jgi:hypothetical protein
VVCGIAGQKTGNFAVIKSLDIVKRAVERMGGSTRIEFQEYPVDFLLDAGRVGGFNLLTDVVIIAVIIQPGSWMGWGLLIELTS